MRSVGNIFKYVRSGEKLRIPAAAYNAMIDAAKAERLRQLTAAAGALLDRLDYDVLVKNDTGSDLNRFSIVALGELVTLPVDRLDGFKERQAFSAAVPAAADRGRFAVLQESVRAGGVGRAASAGPVICRVLLLDPTDEDDDYADVLDGQTETLGGAASGAARLLWVEAPADREDPDVAWCVAWLDARGPSDVFRVLVEEDGGDPGSAGGSCTFTYIVKSTRGKSVATLQTPTARRFPDVAYTHTPDDSQGWACYDEDGILVLLDANELPDLEVCEDPADGDGVIDGGTP